MKTEKELEQIKKECAELKEQLAELSEEELKEVAGGFFADGNSSNFLQGYMHLWDQ